MSITAKPTEYKTTRNIPLDYLRCLCTAIIICLHITGFEANQLNIQEGNFNCFVYYFICIILSLGVPPFFMLSGAFMLKKEISSISQFYLKSYGRLLPWCIFFFFVGSLFQILNTAYNKGTIIGDIDLPAFYADWFCRGGSGILWFIPALMGLYLITPLLVWIRKHTNLLVFSLLTIIVFLTTEHVIIPWLQADYTTHPCNWSKGIFFIGHYMLGYCIYSTCEKLPANWPATKIIGALLLITILCFTIGFNYQYPHPAICKPVLNAQAFAPIFISALLFALFTKLKLPDSKLISTISSISIIIYLSHNYLPLPIIRFGLKWLGIWDTLYRTSFSITLICYLIAVPFSVVCALALQKGAQALAHILKQKRKITYPNS